MSCLSEASNCTSSFAVTYQLGLSLCRYMLLCSRQGSDACSQVLSACYFINLVSYKVNVSTQPYHSFILILYFSCVIASITRLAYAIKYAQVNIEGNYAVNFDNKFESSLPFSPCLPTPNSHSRCSEHDNVVRHRNLRLHHLRKPPLLRSPPETCPHSKIHLHELPLRYHGQCMRI